MPLFDDIVRTEIRARRQNESTFDYLNTSARPGIQAARDLLETWFEHLPGNAQADVRGRFGSRNEVSHQSAFFELFWHELLRRSGYDVEIHPAIAGVTTNPDFLASRGGVPQFYVEVTLAMPPHADAAADRRLAELHDTLDRMDSPDFYLEMKYRGTPEGNVRGRNLRERLERWLLTLNYDEIAQMYREQEYSQLPSVTVSEQGALFTFTAMPKGPERRGQPGVRPVGIVAPAGFQLVRTHEDIKAAVDGKANKYGDLQLPLLIAVNVMDDFCDGDDVLNALFGEEQVVVAREPNGGWVERWDTRAANGAWRGPRGARNTLVSAVAVTHQLSPTRLRMCAVEVIHNPWAAHPLPPESLPLPQRTIALPDGRVTCCAGMSAANLLGVPQNWPLPDLV